MRIERVLVDKTTAEQWLSRNVENNRGLSPKLVRRYLRDMQSGDWQRNGETIKFDNTGRMIDGQHRLSAIVEGDIAMEFDVVYDLPEGVVKTIDQGRARSTADILRMRGLGTSGETRIIAASSKVALNYLEGVGSTFIRTTAEIDGFINDFPTILTACSVALPLHGVIPPSAVAAVLFLAGADGRYSNLIPSFVEGVRTGAELQEGDPRLALRTAIQNTRARQTATKALDPGFVFHTTARSWNAYAEGRSLAIARYSPNRKARYITPDVTGGPRFGAGSEALKRVISDAVARRVINSTQR